MIIDQNPDPNTVRRPHLAPPGSDQPAATPTYQPPAGPLPPTQLPPTPSAPYPAQPGGPDPDRWGYRPHVEIPPLPPVRPPDGPPPPGGSAKRRWLAVATVAVLAAAGVVIGLLVSGGDSNPGHPGDAVQTYLEDLAAGDATGALAQGTTPPSTTFLTAAILHRQQAADKISAVRILGSSTSGSQATVHATYRFGSRAVDTTFALSSSGGHWKLTQTAFEIDISGLGGIPEPTLFDIPITNLGKVYVFPGPLMWGSSNRYFSVAQKDAAAYPTSPTDATANVTQLVTTIGPTGLATVNTAMEKYLSACQASKRVSPKGCPQSTEDDGAIDGTVVWKLVTKPDNLKVTVSDDALTTLNVAQPLIWRCTYRAKDATTHRIVTLHSDGIEGDVAGTIDLTQATPSFTQTG